MTVPNGRSSLDLIDAAWPRAASIDFTDVVLKYAPDQQPALNGVSFSIKARDKVGIVGNVGSGKSTLLLALYRMFNLSSGCIKIDGVDISTVPLARLRRTLAIIPQEPVSFSGTLRANLDAYNDNHDDDVLWDVLKKVGLDAQARTMGGLDVQMNCAQAWTLGQRQLLCLARAKLKQAPILCLDEATASMDPHTEELVLRVAEKLFVDCTTITIAHRLDVVIKSDQVIVMDGGKVKEMAAPKTLLDDRASAFSQQIELTGTSSARALKAMATAFFMQRQAEGHAK